jgi:C-terminal processing protease CtpA/Prc
MTCLKTRLNHRRVGTGCTVTDLLVGSPAMSSRQIERGDVILAVDGQPATAHNIVHLIHSPDIPGTCVTLTMQQRDGGERDLTLTRMASAKAAERKKLFDLFASLRVHLLQHSGDREGGLILEQCMQQWASLAQEEYEHQHAVANRVSTLYRETSQQVPTSWASTRLQTELIQSLSLDLQRAQLLELKLKVDREQLTLAQQGLELAHKDLKKAASSMQEYRAMLNQSEAALAEHKDAANKEHQKAAQVVEQLREALAKVRRDNSQKQDVTADRDSAAMEIVMHERDRARADLEESKRQLERVLQVQARSDSLVQVLQNKLRELEDKSADFKASAKRAGVGIVVDTHVDGTLRVRNLVRGGAADEEGSLKVVP